MNTSLVPLAAAAATLALLGCKNEDRPGLPPASEWHRPTEAPQAREAEDEVHGEVPDDEIHGGAGLGPATGDMPDDEIHGGGGGGGGGSAGMPEGHGGAAASDQPIDPTKFLEGTVVAGAEAKQVIKPGMVLYLSTKPVGTPDCVTKIKGLIPNASQKVTSPTLPFKFKLTEADARMMGGGKLDGEYLLCAHLSTTGDASDREAGDAFGGVKVKVPQKGIQITLDSVLP